MLKEIFSFEVRYHLRQPLFYICVVVFFLMTFGAITTDTVQIGGAIGNVNRNAPFVIMQILLVMSIIGVFATTAFVANATYRDFEHQTHVLFFSTPIHKRDYLFGRFLGSTLVAFLVFFAVALAIIIGAAMPWLEAERVGPFQLTPYLFAMFVMVLPNIALTGAVFFSLATATRSMLYTYVGVALFFVLYIFTGVIFSDVEDRAIASLLDPFGINAFAIASQYWTVFEKNTMVPALTGDLLVNRLLWLGVAAAVLGVTYARFRFDANLSTRKRRKKAAVVEEEPVLTSSQIVTPAAEQKFDGGGTFRQLLWQTRVEVAGVVKSVPFLVILLLAILNVMGGAYGTSRLYGTSIYPVTHLMLDAISSNYQIFALIIVGFYAGELVWRERSLKLRDVYDALPVPTPVFWLSKFVALAVTTVLLLIAGMVATIIIQLMVGYTNLEPSLYLRGMFFVNGPWFILLAVLAIFLQVITNSKYLGFLGVVLYFVAIIALPNVDLEHHLYLYGTSPNVRYSDMNGYGHFVMPTFWFLLYWAFFAGLLMVLVHLFWVRGSEERFAIRRLIASRRFTSRAMFATVLLLAGMAASGCYVYYNTNVINRYVTEDERNRMAADSEKLYKKYERIPQPKITSARVDVDIFPKERRVDIRGSYVIVNKTGKPLTDLHVMINPEVKIKSIGIPGAQAKERDTKFGYYIYRLGQPMSPGAQLTMTFDLSAEERGFENERSNTEIVYNGTFINNMSYFPHIGYQGFGELDNPNERRKYGLPPIQRLPKINDAGARMHNYLTSESDWLMLETTVSTSPDQMALAPGYLQKEWQANGRRYFHYKMDAPILGFWSYLSARYEVRRDQWNGVKIEVYYHKAHPYNVDRMIDSVKKSLDYFTKNFGPYQHRQVRILEFPGYQRFAQSFPNTIPYSESIGFIARIRDEEDIDYPFYVTAHEVAHQWWAHQVIGGNVQGCTLMSETLSQYSALMVMEKEYGQQTMRKFLKYELDNYLRGRGGEQIEELPLALVENQPYIHYRKGSLIMYALRDYIGEASVNRALARFVANKKFQEPPYPISHELIEELRRETPADKQAILDDLFSRITIYESRTSEATWTKRADGKYLVKLSIDAQKYYSDGGGRETAASKLDELVDVGVFGPKPKDAKKQPPVLYFAKHRVTQPKTTLELVVASEPARAGVDPYHKLIDRNPEDNTKGVTEK